MGCLTNSYVSLPLLLDVVSSKQMYPFFNPAGLDGKRDGNHSGFMEGSDKDGTFSLPSPRSYSSPSINDSPTNIVTLSTRLTCSRFLLLLAVVRSLLFLRTRNTQIRQIRVQEYRRLPTLFFSVFIDLVRST